MDDRPADQNRLTAGNLPATAAAAARFDQVGQEVLDSASGELNADLGDQARGRSMYGSLEEACAVEYPRLVRVLTLYCGQRDIAMDLTQETLARACAHWRQVERMNDQRAWFTRVALNVANSRWRRLVLERRATALLADRSLPSAAPIVDPTTAVVVRAALAELTPRQRAAVVLRHFEDLDLTATAKIMNCGPGTVKKLTARGLADLRVRLQAELEGTEDGDA